ncbi:MAG: lysylphosphatidylglycerol synthase domain-containing protein [Acidilobus sp.]
MIDLSLSSLAADLKEVGYAVLLGSIINVGLTLLWAVRWTLGLRHLGIGASYTKVLVAITSSFPIGNLLPAGKAAQEAFRIAYLEIGDGRRPSVMAAVTMEWASEGLILAALLTSVIVRHYLWGALTLAALGTSASQSVAERAKSAVADLLGSIRALARDRKLMALYMSVSAIIIAADVAKVWLLANLNGISLGLFDLLILYVVMRVTSVAPTPAALGFLDVSVIGALELMGYSTASAALFLLSLRFVDTVVPSLVGLLVLAASGGWRVVRQLRGSAWRR